MAGGFRVRGILSVTIAQSQQKREAYASRLILRNKKRPACWLDALDVGVCLSSRAASSQVFSAQVSLTAVFGMGTGVPSPPSTPTVPFWGTSGSISHKASECKRFFDFSLFVFFAARLSVLTTFPFCFLFRFLSSTPDRRAILVKTPGSVLIAHFIKQVF